MGKTMIFLNPNVISNKIQYNDSLLKFKSFTASVTLHGTLMAAALYFASQHPILLPKEEPVMISLADYAPISAISPDQPQKASSKSVPMVHNVLSKRSPASTSHKSPSFTPPVADSFEVLTPKSSPVLPSVAPSDLTQKYADLLHSNQQTIDIDSPKITPAVLANELPKSVSQEEINGATLGRIRAMIENSLTYPAIARKLRLEGMVTVSFLLRPNGLVEKAEILSSSGSVLLDAKAIQTVLALSGDYPALPKAAYLKIPIAFSLKKS
jgi:periplasmic protein TonB